MAVELMSCWPRRRELASWGDAFRRGGLLWTRRDACARVPDRRQAINRLLLALTPPPFPRNSTPSRAMASLPKRIIKVRRPSATGVFLRERARPLGLPGRARSSLRHLRPERAIADLTPASASRPSLALSAWPSPRRPTSQETQRLVADPAPGISAIPHEDNLRYFDVIIAGPDGSPFSGQSLLSSSSSRLISLCSCAA